MSMPIKISAFTFCLISMTSGYAQTPAPEPSPSPSLKSSGRLLELRTYYANPGKLEDVHKRFRDHTMQIFAKHGMTVVGFWGPVYKKDGSEDRLVYMLSFKDRAERDAKWKEFGSDPEWQKVSKESEVNGKLLEKVESVFLYDTDYAPVK
jgi:NIPSNAP protein